MWGTLSVFASALLMVGIEMSSNTVSGSRERDDIQTQIFCILEVNEKLKSTIRNDKKRK